MKMFSPDGREVLVNMEQVEILKKAGFTLERGTVEVFAEAVEEDGGTIDLDAMTREELLTFAEENNVLIEDADDLEDEDIRDIIATDLDERASD